MDQEERKEFFTHIKEHIAYPATKDEILRTCSNIEHVPMEERKWVAENLPEKEFQNAEEVIDNLKME